MKCFDSAEDKVKAKSYLQAFKASTRSPCTWKVRFLRAGGCEGPGKLTWQGDHANARLNAGPGKRTKKRGREKFMLFLNVWFSISFGVLE